MVPIQLRPFVIVFMLLLSQISLSNSITTHVNLSEKVNGARYWIGIGTRANTITGHSFVLFGREDELRQRTEVKLVGFYSSADYFPFYNPGFIKNEFESKNHITNFDYVVFRVDEIDYKNAINELYRWELYHGNYNIATNNCVTFVKSAIETNGLKLPDTFLESPAKFIKAVDNQIRTRGIEYGDSQLVLLNRLGDTEVYENRFDMDNSRVRISGAAVTHGKKINGKLEGEVYIEDPKYGRAIFHYVDGAPDYSKTEILDPEKFKAEGDRHLYTYDTLTVYYEYGKRMLFFEKGKLIPVKRTLEVSNAVCEETNITFDSYHRVCKFKDGSYYEKDMRGEVRGNEYIEFPASDKTIWRTREWTFQGKEWYDEGATFAEGTMTFANGDTYTGTFRNMSFHGWGTLTTKRGGGLNSEKNSLTTTWNNGVAEWTGHMRMGNPGVNAMQEVEEFKNLVKVPPSIPNAETAVNKPSSGQAQSAVTPQNATPVSDPSIEKFAETAKRVDKLRVKSKRKTYIIGNGERVILP